MLNDWVNVLFILIMWDSEATSETDAAKDDVTLFNGKYWCATVTALHILNGLIECFVSHMWAALFHGIAAWD